jgi:hypothetical protein
MPVFRVIEGNIISEAEYRSKRNELVEFVSARAAGHAKSEFALSSARKLAATAPRDLPTTGFTPIGKGLPLTIMIREIYTGEHPERGIFGGDGDVAVVSALKSYEVFNASTRALNFLVKNVDQHTRLEQPSPFLDGTSLVAYSPAVMTDSLTVGFELAVATFPLEFVNSLTNAIGTLSGIPLLLPYAGYLLGAGQVLKLVGNIGHALFDGIKFSVTSSIDFDVPGTESALSGFRIVAESDEFASHTYTSQGGVVDANGNKYSGDSPYIVISLDGKPNDNLRTFAPTVASAAVLQRFFEAPDGGQVAIDTVVQGLKYVSDFKYREQAIKLRDRLAERDLDEPTKKQLQSQLDATLKNILTDELKPK